MNSKPRWQPHHTLTGERRIISRTLDLPGTHLYLEVRERYGKFVWNVYDWLQSADSEGGSLSLRRGHETTWQSAQSAALIAVETIRQETE